MDEWFMDLEYLWSDIIFKKLLLQIAFIRINVCRMCPFYALCQKQHDQGHNCNRNNEAQWFREFIFHFCPYLKPMEVNKKFSNDTVVFEWSQKTTTMKPMKFHSCVASENGRIKPSLAVEEHCFLPRMLKKNHVLIIQKYI